MKVILSRKGFDSEFGGMPSPILPDGTLLSIPIPSSTCTLKYSDLHYKDKSYLEILGELNPKFNKDTCHLDPDICLFDREKNNDWVPLFGQCGTAQRHLINKGVSEGDIFLFFGWFKQTGYDSNGKLRFIKNAPDLNIIYGYMQIEEIITDKDRKRKEFTWHPHSDLRHYNMPLDCMYKGSDTLSINNKYKGYGTFKLMDNLILTMPGMTRTRWKLLDVFKDSIISYHSESSIKDNYFQSAARGQEFVIDDNEKLKTWVLNIIEEQEKLKVSN